MEVHIGFFLMLWRRDFISEWYFEACGHVSFSNSGWRECDILRTGLLIPMRLWCARRGASFLLVLVMSLHRLGQLDVLGPEPLQSKLPLRRLLEECWYAC